MDGMVENSRVEIRYSTTALLHLVATEKYV
jgi:hypothetical protein